MFKNWSNLFFLVPFIFALSHQLYFYSLVVGLVIIASVVYHCYNENKFKWLDALLAWLIILINLYYCWIGRFAFPYFYIALILVVPAMQINFFVHPEQKKFNLLHGLWHLLASLICLFSLLTYYH